MKKRSMLAIASLATGFVVAAVTPSHAAGEGLEGIGVKDALNTLDQAVDTESLNLDYSTKEAAKKATKKPAKKARG
ncbi:hypothetical protein HCJ93_00070 [Streptomyces sp. SBST2-5]|uniref:Secreted protein n=1 Tax=Streptomyces composti TaxID=2720025 RepID=A0ABX1A3P0_9ACTN|nr:hypothetical protein [Streptomyces composti]NJP48509.1 hypothetical protein [Streptomyces composti]